MIFFLHSVQSIHGSIQGWDYCNRANTGAKPFCGFAVKANHRNCEEYLIALAIREFDSNSQPDGTPKLEFSTSSDAND
ncbi:MAG: hypothetical protein JWO20_998 [Candidatus Angelobacter sp.]|nr:hypothetical protein [Candidatus Angelobacter sp.]